MGITQSTPFLEQTVTTGNTPIAEYRGPTVYVDADYQGKGWSFSPGKYNFDQVSEKIGNDIISSVRVPPGWQVTLFEHADYQGQQLTLNADAPRLPAGWNDQTSSMIVSVITPPGCVEDRSLSLAGLFNCPGQQVSIFRSPRYDPPNPTLNIGGVPYYLRQSFAAPTPVAMTPVSSTWASNFFIFGDNLSFSVTPSIFTITDSGGSTVKINGNVGGIPVGPYTLAVTFRDTSRNLKASETTLAGESRELNVHGDSATLLNTSVARTPTDNAVYVLQYFSDPNNDTSKVKKPVSTEWKNSNNDVVWFVDTGSDIVMVPLPKNAFALPWVLQLNSRTANGFLASLTDRDQVRESARLEVIGNTGKFSGMTTAGNPFLVDYTRAGTSPVVSPTATNVTDWRGVDGAGKATGSLFRATDNGSTLVMDAISPQDTKRYPVTLTVFKRDGATIDAGSINLQITGDSATARFFGPFGSSSLVNLQKVVPAGGAQVFAGASRNSLLWLIVLLLLIGTGIWWYTKRQ